MLLLRILLFTLAVPIPVTIGVPTLLAWRSGALHAPTGAAWAWAGAAVGLLGAAGYAWCALNFARHGRGTPAPYDPPRELVVAGPYRFVRNPMYLAALLVVLGQALFWASLLIGGYALALLILFHLRVTRYEEPALAREFGAAFDRYRATTPRWLPRVKSCP